MTRENTALGLVALSPIPALIIGLVAMSSAGIPSAVWAQNIVATFLGLLLVAPAFLDGRKPPTQRSRLPQVLVVLALVLLAASLVQPGTEGVRRWLPVGPLNIYVGALVVPILLVLATLLQLRWSAAVAVSAAILTFLQPDASQATGLALGWIVFASGQYGRAAVRPSAVLALVAIATLFRADPLDPVAHVEGIVGLTARMGPLWTVGAALTLVLPPLVLFTRSHRASAALGAYLVAVLVAAWLGHFPVPFMGYGTAPIVGFYLAILCLGRFPAPVPPHEPQRLNKHLKQSRAF